MNFLKNTGLKNKKTYIKAYNYLQNGKFEESLRLFNYLLDENYRSFSILFNLITIHNELNVFTECFLLNYSKRLQHLQ